MFDKQAWEKYISLWEGFMKQHHIEDLTITRYRTELQKMAKFFEINKKDFLKLDINMLEKMLFETTYTVDGVEVEYDLSTKNTTLKAVRNLYRYIGERTKHKIDESIFKVKFYKIKVKDYDVLTRKEVDGIFDYLSTTENEILRDFKTLLFTFMIKYGFRISEAINLKVGDLK